MNMTPQYYATQVGSVADINKCTCQFLILKEGVPKAHGTGVLIKVHNTHFIITAAHVIENYEEKVHVRFVQNGMTRIWFELIINKSNVRKDDKTDIALLRLFDETVLALNGFYNFLDERELGINHDMMDSPVYVGFGYPASLTKIHYKTKALTTESTFFTTKPATIDIYKKLDCTLSQNIIVHYKQNRFVNTQTEMRGTAPNLHGMSGSGLWFIPIQKVSENQNIEKKLVAILTERPTKDQTYVIYTRIDVVTEMIRNVCNLKLPESAVFRSTFDVEDI